MWGFVYNGVEQHAFDVAFNVLMLKYLRVSNQLDAHVQRTILTDVNKCEAKLCVRTCTYVEGMYGACSIAVVLHDG